MNGIDLHVNVQGGYHPLVNSECCRVAVINGDPTTSAEQVAQWERQQTDRIVVLQKGKCLMFVAGNQERPGETDAVDLLPGSVYKIGKNIWHSCVLTEGAQLLVMECAEPVEQQTQNADINDQTKHWIKLEVIGHWHL